VDIPHRDIQFTTTADGVGIAYWEIGSGIPIILIHNWSISHAELEWSVPSIASFYVALSERYRVIRFDPRGFGMSDRGFFERGVSATGAQLGLSTEEAGLDIAAVAEASGVERFVLMAASSQGPAAIEFAARHPERLIGLVLCNAMAKVEGSWLEAPIRTLAAMSEVEKDAGVAVPVTMYEPAAPADELEEWAALERANRRVGESLTAPVLAMAEWDASFLLGEVEAPTMIIASRSPHFDVLGEARILAAGIPNSQLRIVDGLNVPYVADRAAVLDAIGNLLGTETESDVEESVSDASGFRTVVFTDVVGSTEFMQRVGDEQGRSAMRSVERLVVEAAADHGGTVVKHLGDGSLISFGSNSNALAFAVALQHLVEQEPLQIRVGMAAGEPIQEDGDIHGAVVSQASRVADLGTAGEVMVADSVHQLALGKGYTFEPAGEVSLKGFTQPTKVWKVSTQSS
jgi:class 3 adenylate cyclase/pimeloyl-ACP methyl ester carboxylesterase